MPIYEQANHDSHMVRNVSSYAIFFLKKPFFHRLHQRRNVARNNLPPQKWALPVRIEVKRGPRDKPRKIQWHRMVEAEARGIACYVVWDMQQVKEIEEFWRPLALGKKKPGKTGPI